MKTVNSWHEEPTRHLFFTGKGGVGKTSLACATAVGLADAGKQVLLVSTDPASNLAHVFEIEIGEHDPLARAIREHDAKARRNLPDALQRLPTDHVDLRPTNLVGLDALRGLLGESKPLAVVGGEPTAAAETGVPSLGKLVDAIEADGHGLVMVLGKGDVGKTTIAAAVAVELAARGHDVHLTTTDPAAHVAETIESEVEHVQVSRIDPLVETQRYRQHVLETKGKDLDDQGRAVLEEDLRSPCTEEIAVFQAFSRVLREASSKFVVMDTAPTGHTLLLLDATGSYHRDVMRHLKDSSRATTPMMRLQDPAQTKMLIVALPETTPVLEAAAMQEDLRRAGVEPWAWVLNASLAAAGPTDPLLNARARSELAEIRKVREQFASRLALTPWVAKEPVGQAALRELCHTAVDSRKSA